MSVGKIEIKGFINNDLSFDSYVTNQTALSNVFDITCEWVEKYEIICDNDDDYIDLSMAYAKNKDIIVTRRY